MFRAKIGTDAPRIKQVPEYGCDKGVQGSPS
jgi:hypothetical protein